MSVIVTGGAGDIGSHMVLDLLDAGETVIVLDNLSTGFRSAIPEGALLVEGDIADQALVAALIRDHAVDAIADFAGSIIVPESVSTHLFKLACQTALGRRPVLTIFGTDDPTRDGTCVRDDIHVSDLIGVHMAALAHLRGGGDSQVLNRGYGHGYSVREIVDRMKVVSGVDFPVELAPRRDGDPATLVASTGRPRGVLNWTPRSDDLDLIMEHNLAWERRLLARSPEKTPIPSPP
jgi:UDP-glucose 4-epimerase